LFLGLFVCLFLFVCLSVCLFVCLFLCWFVWSHKHDSSETTQTKTNDQQECDVADESDNKCIYLADEMWMWLLSWPRSDVA
jgi:hypothetical protein